MTIAIVPSVRIGSRFAVSLLAVMIATKPPIWSLGPTALAVCLK